ncbi:MAG: pentapeptide repeat-containing protein [Acidimicrobiales bacterium]
MSDLTIEDLRTTTLIGADLRGRDLSGLDLSGLDLSNADLSDARLIGSNLTGSILFGTTLNGAQFTGADLSEANLSNCNAVRTGFGGCDLRNAVMIGAELESATLSTANLTMADLRGAVLDDARLHEADLTDAELTNASAHRADLTDAVVAGANFTDTDLSDAVLRRIKGFDSTCWIGTNVANADFTGAYTARRVISDRNYLHEFRSRDRRHLVLYEIWRITSGCGQSAARWGVSTLLVAVLFAMAYTQVEIDYGSHETALSPLYFSIVTLTTLGFGDVLPASTAGQVLVMVEVIIGYTMLSGLFSIFATRMARRAE